MSNLTTTRLTYPQAHAFLSTYLLAAHSQPSLRPDAFLSSAGVIASSSGAASSLVLQHLSRVLVGIEGRRIRVESLEDGELVGKRKREREVEEQELELERGGGGGGKRRKGVEADENGWVEKEDFEHAQEEVTVEEQMGGVGQPGVVAGRGAGRSGGGTDGDGDGNGVVVTKSGSKELGQKEREARKGEKKARKKAEKSARNEGRKIDA